MFAPFGPLNHEGAVRGSNELCCGKALAQEAHE